MQRTPESEHVLGECVVCATEDPPFTRLVCEDPECIWHPDHVARDVNGDPLEEA